MLGDVDQWIIDTMIHGSNMNNRQIREDPKLSEPNHHMDRRWTAIFGDWRSSTCLEERIGPADSSEEFVTKQVGAIHVTGV